ADVATHRLDFLMVLDVDVVRIHIYTSFPAVSGNIFYKRDTPPRFLPSIGQTRIGTTASMFQPCRQPVQGSLEPHRGRDEEHARDGKLRAHLSPEVKGHV